MSPDRPNERDPTEHPSDLAFATWENEGGSSAPSAHEATEPEVTRPSGSWLPSERADRFTKPFARFLKIEAAAGAALLVTSAVALVIANTEWSEAFSSIWEVRLGVRLGSYELTRSLRHWLDDGLMTLFFFVVALELKRELVLGELRDWRRAALPLAAAVGGMVVPAGVFLVLMANEPGAHGWGTVMATDAAFVVGCLAVLGARTPTSLRLFLLSLAIFDDVGAILVVAIGYGDALVWPALALAALALGLVFVAARLGVRSVAIYSVLGVAVWLAFDASGIHPTIAGVALGLMTPARSWVSDERLRAVLGRVLSHPRGEHLSGDAADRAHLVQASRAAREVVSPLEQLESKLHPWVGFAIMPAFGLVNAGVALSTAALLDPVSVATFAGLVLGKPVGVIAMSWLALRSGVATRSKELSWPLLAAGSCLTGIGFTMSLFIAGLAFSSPRLDAAKVGILGGSIVSAAAGMSALWWLSRKKRAT